MLIRFPRHQFRNLFFRICFRGQFYAGHFYGVGIPWIFVWTIFQELKFRDFPFGRFFRSRNSGNYFDDGFYGVDFPQKLSRTTFTESRLREYFREAFLRNRFSGIFISDDFSGVDFPGIFAGTTFRVSKYGRRREFPLSEGVLPEVCAKGEVSGAVMRTCQAPPVLKYPRGGWEN
jgi:hypothetical protein